MTVEADFVCGRRSKSKRSHHVGGERVAHGRIDLAVQQSEIGRLSLIQTAIGGERDHTHSFTFASRRDDVALFQLTWLCMTGIGLPSISLLQLADFRGILECEETDVADRGTLRRTRGSVRLHVVHHKNLL
jgi:hypothetical protein